MALQHGTLTFTAHDPTRGVALMVRSSLFDLLPNSHLAYRVLTNYGMQPEYTLAWLPRQKMWQRASIAVQIANATVVSLRSLCGAMALTAITNAKTWFAKHILPRGKITKGSCVSHSVRRHSFIGCVASGLGARKLSRLKTAQKRISSIKSHFVAPWARGYGLAKAMIDYAIVKSKENNKINIQLDIRETQIAAIKLFENKGFVRWGENPTYAFVNGNPIKGYYYYKNI